MSKADDKVMEQKRARLQYMERRKLGSTARRGVRRASDAKRRQRSGGYGSIKYY